MDDQEIKNELVNTLLQKRIVGGKKVRRDTLVSQYAALPTHLEGRAKDLLDDIEQAGVIESYGGGHRSNIRLASVDAAVDYLQDNDGDVPFGFG